MIIATDGSVLVNPDGPGGWAWAAEDGTVGHGHHPCTTNNIMELQAIQEALKAHRHLPVITIQSDSQYAINCLTLWCRTWVNNRWRSKAGKPVKNCGLIMDTLQEMAGREVHFEWVKGHNGHVLNTVADKLAGQAARMLI